MLPETTKQRIEQEAREYANKHSAAPDKETPDWIIHDYIAGATAEAKRSAAWKAEATLLINKIHEWAEGDKTLPLGHSVFDEAVKRLKAYDELLKAKAEPGDKSALPDNKDREIALLKWLTEQEAEGKINLCGGDWYWEVDREGDHPLSCEKIHTLWLQSLTNKP